MQMYSKNKLKELAIEESKTAKEYAKHGFPKLAMQEAKHSAFFKMLSKKKN